MTSKLTNFLSSFGIMIIGVILLFAGTVSISPPKKNVVAYSIPSPTIGKQILDDKNEIVPVFLPTSKPRIPLPIDDTKFEKNLSAISAIVVDDDTSRMLFYKNGDEKRSLASITKLMTALVLSDLKITWASTTIVLASDVDTSSHQINPGEKFTLEALWHIALIGSSNSAINALVRSSGLSEQEFVALMNKKATELRFLSMHFEDTTGLDSNNVGSAFDVAKLLKEALKLDKIYKTLQVGEYLAQPIGKEKARRVWTTDWLLTNWIPNKFAQDSIVGKTGYISESGYNFTVRLTSDDQRSVRVVVLGANSNEARFSEARDLAEWVFAHYVWPHQAGYGKLAE